MDKKLIVAYGSKNITLNHGDDHITLTYQEAGFLLASLMNNVRFTKIELK